MLLEGTVLNGAIVLDENASLPEGARVEVSVKAVAEQREPAGDSKPTLLSLLKLAGIAKGLAEDFAAQHDHHIHGTPKR